MTTMNREEQKQVLIDTANHIINRDNTSPYSENLRELARIALSSLEAKPIGAFHIAEQQVDGTSDYLKDGEWPIDNGIIEVYAAPPVPVVPEEMYWQDAPVEGSSKAAAYATGWNACRAAMLQKNANNTPECDNLVTELAMWVKRLVSQLKKAKPDCDLPDKAMNYLEQHRLVGVEDALR
nr:hypothetical protein [Escherichia coli]